MRVYDAPLRVLPFVVAPSYGQQESMQLRPSAALVGPLDSLVSALHEYEQLERPTNPIVVQAFWCNGLYVIALTLRIPISEPQSGRSGATLTVGVLLRQYPTLETFARCVNLCRDAIATWTGKGSSVEAVVLRLEPSLLLSASRTMDELSAVALELAEERFGFNRTSGRVRVVFDRLTRWRERRIIRTAATVDGMVDMWIRDISPVGTAKGAPDAIAVIDREVAFLIGLVAAAGVLSGQLDISSVVGTVVLAAALLGTLAVIAYALWRGTGPGFRVMSRLRDVGLILIAVGWVVALLTHLVFDLR